MNEIKNVPKNKSVTLRKAEKTSNNHWSRDNFGDDIFILSSELVADIISQNSQDFNPIQKKLTPPSRRYIIVSMKKTIIILFVISVMVAGCGVKSALQHPNPDYPREYPVY